MADAPVDLSRYRKLQRHEVTEPLPDQPEGQDYIVACGCGGSTFYVHARGYLSCAMCDHDMLNDVVAFSWPATPPPAPPEARATVVKHGTIFRAMQSLTGKINQDSTLGVVVLDAGGSVHTVLDTDRVETRSQKAWVRKQMKLAARLMLE